MRSDVRNNGKRPRDAYTDMLATVPKRFKEADFQTEVVVNLPSYEVRCQLTRRRTDICIPFPDPLSIPDALRIALRGREAVDGDSNKNETFQLYIGQEGKT